jgi:hypothetical protein
MPKKLLTNKKSEIYAETAAI